MHVIADKLGVRRGAAGRLKGVGGGQGSRRTGNEGGRRWRRERENESGRGKRQG